MSQGQVSRFARLWPKDAACVKAPDHTVSVKAGVDWPSDAGETLLLAFDERGKPLALLQAPTSCSGDWHTDYIHYFDASSRTVAFKRFSSFFHGCDFGAARETSVTHYGPTGTVVGREYRLEDTTGPEQAGAKCQFMYRHKYVIQRDWTSGATALGLRRELGGRLIHIPR